MCGYNRVNDSYACANPEILNHILKDELAFPRYIVSDWEATHSMVGTVNAGLDMERPGITSPTGIFYFGDSLADAIEAGNISPARLDDVATRVMTPYFRLGQDEDFPVTDPAS
jgi:beta-glucosidase